MPVRYSSRVNSSGGAVQPKAGRPTKKPAVVKNKGSGSALSLSTGGALKPDEKKQQPM